MDNDNFLQELTVAGVGITHQDDTEYLRSIPDGSTNDDLGDLPLPFA